MKNRILLTVMAISLTIALRAQTKVELKYDDNIDLSVEDSLLIGFQYSTKNGKIKERGAYFKQRHSLRSFQMKINGARYDKPSGKLVLNRPAIKNNNGFIILEFRHPKKKSFWVRDSISIPQVAELKIRTANVYYGEKLDLSATAIYSNGNSIEVKGNNLQKFLYKNRIELKATGGKVISNCRLVVNPIKEQINSKEGVVVRAHGGVIKLKPRIDSFPIIHFKDISFISSPLFFNQKSPLGLKVIFENKMNREFIGHEAINFLKCNNINIEVKNGTLQNESILVDTLSDNFILNVKLSSGKYFKEFDRPIYFASDYHFHFQGKPMMFHGRIGMNVIVDIKEFDIEHNIYLVNVRSQYKSYSVYFNPSTGVLNVYARGGEGNEGDEGERGSDYTGISEGQRGYDGRAGGDGGDGGNVSITAPFSFKGQESGIVCHVEGGIGGSGGEGGKGGRLEPEEDTSLLLEILVPERAECGNRGPRGRSGRSGMVTYSYY